jgi:type II secretory pathway predicted ATPase ExeA
MYEAHFGLKQRPFRTTPDGTAYYPATSHEAALTRLLQAVYDDEGLTLLTGEPGTGKTLLCHRLLERIGPDVTSAFLTNSHFPNQAGLLQALLYDLGLPYAGLPEQDLRLAATDFLLKQFGEGRRTLLLVDEAQNLRVEHLEELRLLGNLEARHGKALQVVLAAQPAILQTLRLPPLRGLRQRLAVRVHLEPLGLHEAADYLVHHVRMAGGLPERLFADDALEILARGAQGIPRQLNQAAHQALALAYAAEAAAVDVEAAMEALALLGLDESAPSEPSGGAAAILADVILVPEATPASSRLAGEEEEEADSAPPEVEVANPHAPLPFVASRQPA